MVPFRRIILLLIVLIVTFLAVQVLLGSKSSSHPSQHFVNTFIESYEKLHTRSLQSHDRIVVLRLPNAGLGNRLTASVSAIVLGMLMGRAVVIDGGSYRFAKLFSPKVINWDFDALSWEIGSADVSIDESSLSTLLCVDFSSTWTDARVVEISTGQYFLPLLQANPHVQALFNRGGHLDVARDLFGFFLRRYFDPVPHLQSRIQAVLAQLQPDKRHTVGLHLRNIYHSKENKMRQVECAAYVSSWKNSVMYVAADTKEWRDYALSSLKQFNIVVNPDLLENAKNIGHDPQYEGNLAGLEAAVVDMWVLGSCHDLIMSAGSTFSYVAQSLQGHPAVTVTRQGKCVRPLTPEPMSGSFPDASSQLCWKEDMWTPNRDQLCADTLCPISCGGKAERSAGETTQWRLEKMRKDLDSLTPQQRELREAKAKRRAASFQKSLQERPDFWKPI